VRKTARCQKVRSEKPLDMSFTSGQNSPGTAFEGRKKQHIEKQEINGGVVKIV
jgi:hypothetical protein